MDCDTTGVEPDFALVKFKKLAGGGYFKIANGSVKPALEALGYPDEQIREILTYILGTLSLDVSIPRIGDDEPGAGMTLSAWLVDKGLSREDVSRITEMLPGAFELSMAFGAWSLGDEALERMGLDVEQAKADTSFNLLRHLRLSDQQIAELSRVVCGTQTIEGAPHVRHEHLAVFDCAAKCGKTGRRFIRPGGHIRMMAAAQPFISGAISKTINLPSEATVEDIKNAYRLSWELGLKANALYRDGCKLSQPLNASSDSTILDEDEDEDAVDAAREEVADGVAEVAMAAANGDAAKAAEKVRIIHRPLRRRLPDTRTSLTHKFNVAGHEGYLTVGLYEDGSPGELFITMAKEGSTIGGLMDSLGTATSVALQYGVPVESLVNKFTYQRFEPAGMTTNRDIPIAKSLVDYIFRWIGMEFIPGYRQANAPRRESDPDAPAEDARAQEDDRWKDSLRQGSSDSAGSSGAHDAHGAAETTGGGPVTAVRRSALSAAMRSMGDAPPCDVCGTITVRNGTCYKCLNCGHSMGCS
jgi:ribonucleoside-diphosphate reductase alpha chain